MVPLCATVQRGREARHETLLLGRTIIQAAGRGSHVAPGPAVMKIILAQITAMPVQILITDACIAAPRAAIAISACDIRHAVLGAAQSTRNRKAGLAACQQTDILTGDIADILVDTVVFIVIGAPSVSSAAAVIA